MENSTAMTVEFLRARLLFERSVSKGAKQRADELAKKVMELEEQLKAVTLQRTKAEKATVEVLTILENNGTGDFSESFGSNSDHEHVEKEFKEDNYSVEEEENVMSSTLRKSEGEELSSLEHQGSLLSGRSLSWKGCCNSPNSLERKKCIELRGQSSFVTIADSSTNPRVGKSCRMIKPKETIEVQQNGLATGIEGSNYRKDKLEILNEKNTDNLLLIGQGYLDNQEKETNVGFNTKGSQCEDVMEIALVNQVHLTGQYESEETAQRIWEEKLKEDDICTQDSHGNQSSVNEEKKEIREASESRDTVYKLDQEAKSEGTEACLIGETIGKTSANGLTSTECLDVDMGCSQEQECNSTATSGAQTSSEFSFPNQENPGKGKERQEWSDIPCGLSGRQSTKDGSLQDDGSQHSGQSSSEPLNELQIAIWHEKPNELRYVLEALQRAKLSLKQELNRSPLSESSWPIMGMKEILHPVDRLQIPNSCAGLFRTPTDFECKATTHANFLPPHFESKASLTRNNINVEMARRDQYCYDPSLEMASRISSLRPYYDPWMNGGPSLPTSHNFKYASSREMKPGIHSNNAVPKTLPSTRSDMPFGDFSSIYYNHDRSNGHYMY